MRGEMSEIVVSAPSDASELEAYLPVHRRTYLMSPEISQRWMERVPNEHFRIAKRDDKPVGGAVVFPIGQWFGGRSVPSSGISAVGIEPAERASGAGTALMRAILTELHENGTALSSLYPATQTVYRRCGYELAGDNIRYRLGTDDVDVRDRALTIELSDDREVFAMLYSERARRTSAVLDRTTNFWKRLWEPWDGDVQGYLVGGDDGPEGYVLYSLRAGEPMRNHMYADTVALTAAAARRILTFVADHRSFTQSFNWNGPPADAFTFHLAEPRRQVQLSWPWMMRIVDVERAFVERGYAMGLSHELHLDVADDVLPGNAGRYVLNVSGGKADVRKGGDGRLRVDVRGLAALYGGYMCAEDLVATGYIEAAESDLAAASAVFAGPAPWLADFF